jgi:hypothetical protein
MCSHVPVVDESVEPGRLEPDTTGATVFTATGSAGVSVFDVPVSVPDVFVPVTTQVMACASSASTSVYVLAVAPPMFTAFRCH